MRQIFWMIVLAASFSVGANAQPDCYEKYEICRNVCEYETKELKKCEKKCEKRLNNCLKLSPSPRPHWRDPFDSSGVPSPGKGGKEHYWQGVY